MIPRAFPASEDQRAFLRHVARQFAAERMLPDAARWDAEKIFPVGPARGGGGAGLRWHLCPGGRRRQPVARCGMIMEELAAACPSTAAYFDPQHGRLDDRRLRRRRAAPTLPAETVLDGAFRQLPTEPGAGSDAATS